MVSAGLHPACGEFDSHFPYDSRPGVQRDQAEDEADRIFGDELASDTRRLEKDGSENFRGYGGSGRRTSLRCWRVTPGRFESG